MEFLFCNIPFGSCSDALLLVHLKSIGFGHDPLCESPLYIFLFAISPSSESEGEDGYDLSTQFNEVPQETDDNTEPVNVDQELAMERSLQHCEPPIQKTQEEVDRYIFHTRNNSMST